MSAPSDEQLPLRTRRPVNRSRLTISLLVVVAVAVGMLPDLLGLDRFSPFAQLVAFRTASLALLLVVAAAATVVALVRRRGWTLAAGLLVVVVVAAGLVLPRALPLVDAPAPDAPGARTLTVLSFNTYEGGADVAALADLIRATRPDLIALPESAGRFSAKLAPLVTGYRFVPSQERGRDVNGVTAAVRSDLGGVSVQVDRSTTNLPTVELSGGGLGTVRFVAFHSVAPKPGDVTGWRSDLGTLDRFCATPAAGPVIVAGDFNATLDHSVFRNAIRGCTDAADATGEGLTPTWPTWLPRWLGPQIDHVIVSGGITAETFSVHAIPDSDHRAVLTRLRLPT